MSSRGRRGRGRAATSGPSAEGLRKAAGVLRSAIEWLGDAKLDMGTAVTAPGRVVEEGACVGCWYMLGLFAQCRTLNGNTFHYIVGGKAIARDCGLPGVYSALPDWAHGAPKIWGNIFGERMWRDGRAWLSENAPVRVSDVVAHLQAVADCLEAA